MPDDNHISIFPVTSLACNQRRPFTLGPWKNPDCCFLKRAARGREPHRRARQGRSVCFVLACLCMRGFSQENSEQFHAYTLVLCLRLCLFVVVCVCVCEEKRGELTFKGCPSGLCRRTSTNPSHFSYLSSVLLNPPQYYV